MARRGRDLFELLEMRLRGDQQQPSRRQRARAASSGAGPLRSALGWLREQWAARSRPRGGKSSPRRSASRRSRAAGPAAPGLWIAALVLVAAGAGFLLGRGTASAARAGAEDLRASQEMQRPGPLPGLSAPPPGASDLGPQKEVETLSQDFFRVLTYPGSQRDRASDLARYLRDHDLETARIRPATSARTGQPLWAVFVYVLDRADQDTLAEQLRNVPPPDFEPRFAQRMALPLELYMFEPVAGKSDH